MPRILDRDESGAASSVVAFLVAGVVFVGSVGALLLTSRDAADSPGEGAADAATLRLQSESLADLLFASPGFLTSGGLQAWPGTAAGANELARLGLLNTTADGTPIPGQVSFDKFQNLRRAGLAANPTDGLVNYPEARTSLGLDDHGLDFHIRAFPTLKSVQDMLATAYRDPNMRVTYIGDADQVQKRADDTAVPADAGLVVGAPTCAPRADGKAYTVSNVITNGGGDAVQLRGVYRVDLSDDSSNNPFEDRTRSYIIAKDASATLSIDVPAKSGRSCSGGTVQLEVWDKDIQLGSTRSWAGLTGSTASSSTLDFWVNPGKTWYVFGDTVQVEFGGDMPSTGSDDVTLNLRVRKADGTQTLAWTAFALKGNAKSITVPSSAFVEGSTDYLVDVEYVSFKLNKGALTAVNFVQTDPVLVLASGSPKKYVPNEATVTETVDSTSMAVEVGYLNQLVDKFCPYFFDSTTSTAVTGVAYADRCAFKATTPALSPAQPGDVFRDLKSDLDNELPRRLLGTTPMAESERKCQGQVDFKPNYEVTNVLVVGSNVAHNSMTSAGAKYALCEWVFGGGTLIVFGSASQQVHWLQPIFHSAIASSSFPISTPDPSHPLLNRADRLGYDAYDTRGKHWTFNGPTAAEQENLLTNVVKVGQDSDLTISNPGAFGDGTVILTSWLPYDLYNTGIGSAPLEGLKVVNNLLQQGYRDLFLDYGPSIPTESRQAAASQRIIDVRHPDFADPVTLTVFVYVF